MSSARALARSSILLAAVACGGGGGGGGGGPAAVVPQGAGGIAERAFFVSLHALPPDWSSDPDELHAIMTAAYAEFAAHSDLLSHQITAGVPWLALAAGQPLPADVESDLATRAALSPGPVYVGTSPLNAARDGLAPDAGLGALPPPWDALAFDDPLVVSNYVAWCRLLIERFAPEVFAYAIEPNMIALADKAPASYAALLSLLQQTYAALKLEYPALPLCLTVQIDYLVVEPVVQEDVLAELLLVSDLVAVSTYPWFVPTLVGALQPGELPPDWFDRVLALAPGKPFAIAETGGAAEDLDLPGLGLSVPASPLDQLAVLDLLLADAQRLGALFVAWLSLHDLDAFLASGAPVPPSEAEILSIFKDMGLIDELGEPRPSLALWDAWVAAPHVPAP